MKILYAAAEAAPILKKGGLGDVAGSLPPALARIGCDVRLVLPWHPEIDTEAYPIEEKAGYGIGRLGDAGIPVYFVARDEFDKAYGDGKHPEMAKEEELYEKFSLGIFEFLKRSDWKPDIFHGNDWHISRALAILEITTGRELYNWGFEEKSNLATVFTIHNLGYFWTSLRQAVLTADIINTVSPSYAKEILTPEYCTQLCPELNQRRSDLYGVLNGIDYGTWNPEIDDKIAFQYRIENRVQGKLENKRRLQEEAGFTASDAMLVGFVGRLDPRQKGVELIAQAIDKFSECGCQLVILGSGDPEIENKFREAGEKHPGLVSANIKYDEAFAHRIYAGADALLIPSKYEPCGLIQMIAMKYGTLPIAHAVGGLKDTIGHGETGYLYDEYSLDAMVGGIMNAQYDFLNNRDNWNRMMENAMWADFSWDRSAEEYVKLYEKALGKSRK